MKKPLEEFGKQLLTIGTASVIFGFLQPLASNKFSINVAIVFFFFYVMFTALGTVMLIKSEEKE